MDMGHDGIGGWEDGTWLWGRQDVWKCAREDNDRTNTSNMTLILVFRRVVLRSPSKRLPSLGVPFTRTVTSNEGLTVDDLERRIAQLDRRIRVIEEDHNYPKKVRGRYKYCYECRLEVANFGSVVYNVPSLPTSLLMICEMTGGDY